MRRISPISLVPVLCLVSAAETAHAQLMPAQSDISSVIFVDADAAGANDGSSWADAFTDLQDALAAARADANVDEIWVAEGTYHPAPPSGDRNIRFQLVGGVGHYGGFAGWESQREQRDWDANVTVLSGDLDDNDTPSFGHTSENSYHVIDVRNVNGAVVLDGFSIIRGNGNGYGHNGRGGGILVTYNHLLVRNCDVNSNQARYGAGMHCTGGSLTVVNCEFGFNRLHSSYGKGGGLYLNSGVASLSSSSFHNHTGAAGSYGGGVHARAAALEIEKCAFFDNDYSRFGAGVSVVDCVSVSARDCEFVNNEFADFGGGLYANRVHQLSLKACRFNGNLAGAGGGAYIVGDYPQYHNAAFHDCTFSDNTSADGGGGGIWSAECTTTLRDCVFDDNDTWGGGGAICDYEGALRLANCVLTNNSADKGGAIWNSHSLLMVNCLITRNRALSDWGAGGALYTQLNAKSGQTSVVNCTIVGNRALYGYGGGVFAGNLNETFMNNIIWNNLGQYGIDESAQLHRTTSLINIDYCDIQGLSGDFGGEGNIDADPAFVTPGYWFDNGTPYNYFDDIWIDGDYRLTAGSPCADAGDNTTIPADVFDLDADGDVGERVPLDLAGAFRFVDDPLANDVGVADPPDYPEIVDMGAYEHGSCVGDLDGDGEIGLDDLAILLGHYGGVGVGYENGDLDRDGDIGLSDLGTLLAVYGQSCQ